MEVVLLLAEGFEVNFDEFAGLRHDDLHGQGAAHPC